MSKLDRVEELTTDILKTKHYLECVDDFETRLAFTRLLEILKSWRMET